MYVLSCITKFKKQGANVFEKEYACVSIQTCLLAFMIAHKVPCAFTCTMRVCINAETHELKPRTGPNITPEHIPMHMHTNNTHTHTKTSRPKTRKVHE